MCKFNCDFSTDFKVIIQKQVIVLVDAAFNGVFNWHNTVWNLISVNGFEDVAEVLAGYRLDFAAEEFVDSHFAVSTGFSLIGYFHCFLP